MNWLNSYILSLLLALDQLANAITFGSHKETISQRAAIAERNGNRIGCFVCRVLNFFHRDHCKKSLDPNYTKGLKL